MLWQGQSIIQQIRLCTHSINAGEQRNPGFWDHSPTFRPSFICLFIMSHLSFFIMVKLTFTVFSSSTSLYTKHLLLLTQLCMPQSCHQLAPVSTARIYQNADAPLRA